MQNDARNATPQQQIDPVPRPIALVTGASSGIGRDFALALAARGYDLVVVARREDRLIALKREVATRFSARAMVIAMDLAVTTAPREIHSIVEGSGLEVSYLVNNAGYGTRGRFLDASWSSHADFLQVMCGSWLHLTHLMLPLMVKRGHGRILNVSSLASLTPEPPGSLYGPVKAMMTGASRALRLDLLATGVHCTALCPGFTRTEFHDTLGCREAMNKLPKYLWQDSRTVVDAGMRGVEENRAVVVPGLSNKLIALMCKLLPYALTSQMIPRAMSDAPHTPR